MKFSWGDSIFFAFLWASVWAGALTCYVLDWKVEWMQPKLWFLYVKKKLNKSKSIFFKATKISQKVLNPFETVLTALEDGNIQNSSVNIGQSYRQKIEHEMKLLQANDITHEIRIAYAKLPEANKKNHDFKHWNDAGREWREAILQGTVSNRYRNKKSGKILYEDFFPHGAILLRQSRHIRHDEVESKNRNEEQQFYSEYQKIMCPSCGAEISLNSNEVHCPYCGGYIKSDFFDWQIEELLIYQDLNPNDYNYKMVAATRKIQTGGYENAVCHRLSIPYRLLQKIRGAAVRRAAHPCLPHGQGEGQGGRKDHLCRMGLCRKDHGLQKSRLAHPRRGCGRPTRPCWAGPRSPSTPAAPPARSGWRRRYARPSPP